tara:strand:- start:2841 stop:2993 length:153 start_codon:yes stop_codon:yes gene_type:complete
MVKRNKPRNFIKLDMDLHCKPQTFMSKKNDLLEKVADKEIDDWFIENENK